MSRSTEPNIKRQTAKRKSALIKEKFKGQATISEAARQRDLTPSVLDDAESGMENTLRANSRDVADQYEHKIKQVHEAYCETILDLKVRKKLTRHLGSGED